MNLFQACSGNAREPARFLREPRTVAAHETAVPRGPCGHPLREAPGSLSSGSRGGGRARMLNLGQSELGQFDLGHFLASQKNFGRLGPISGSNALAGPAPLSPSPASLLSPPSSPPLRGNVKEVRVCVKASPAEGRRRLHTYTAHGHLWAFS